jgi:hypothetical protein
MENDATRCSSCGQLRKDIYEDKIKTYIFCGLGGGMLGVGIVMHSYNSMKVPLLVIGAIVGIVGLYFSVIVGRKLKTHWWF